MFVWDWQCHEKFLGKIVPSREDVAWMSEYAMITYAGQLGLVSVCFSVCPYRYSCLCVSVSVSVSVCPCVRVSVCLCYSQLVSQAVSQAVSQLVSP